MDPFATVMQDVLADLRRQLYTVVESLDDAAINRAYPGLQNTIGILLRHIAGSERYWIGGVAGGGSTERDRSSEFGREPLRKEALLEEIRRVEADSQRVLAAFTAADLQAPVEVRRASQGPVEKTKTWAVLHAIQHLAYHLGQIRLMAAQGAGGAPAR